MENLFNKIVKFHGHRCPGIAYGMRIALAGMKFIAATEESDLKIESPTDNCPLDAIQIITGCTVGNGKLKIQLNDDYGFTFSNLTLGKSVIITNRKINYANPVKRNRKPGKIELDDKIRIILNCNESDIIKLISAS